MNDLSDLRFSLKKLEEPRAPLWRRTQLRLQNMERFTAQRMNMSDGFCPAIQKREEKIALAGEELVELLKIWEEINHPSHTSKPLDTGV